MFEKEVNTLKVALNAQIFLQNVRFHMTLY